MSGSEWNGKTCNSYCKGTNYKPVKCNWNNGREAIKCPWQHQLSATAGKCLQSKSEWQMRVAELQRTRDSTHQCSRNPCLGGGPYCSTGQLAGSPAASCHVCSRPATAQSQKQAGAYRHSMATALQQPTARGNSPGWLQDCAESQLPLLPSGSLQAGHCRVPASTSQKSSPVLTTCLLQ